MSGSKTRVEPFPNANDEPEQGLTTILDEWCGVTPWHCINNVHQAKNRCAKIAWLLLVLFTAFLAFYQSGTLITDYVAGSKWITSVTYEIPEDGGIDWPNISVCNLNDNFKSRFAAYNLSDPYEIVLTKTMSMEGILFYKQYQADWSDTSDNDTIEQTRQQYASRIGTGPNLTVSEMLEILTIKCNATIVHCGRSGTFKLHDRYTACCDGLQRIRWSSCLSIHPTVTFGKSRESIDITSSYYPGVWYLLDPNVYDYYDKLLLNNVPSAGFRLSLYYGTLEASNPTTVLLQPGTHAFVSLIPRKHKIMKQRSSVLPVYQSKEECRDDVIYEYHYVMTSAYSKQYCKTDCSVSYEIHLCNCTLRTVRLKANWECRGQAIQTCYELGSNPKNWNKTFDDGFNFHQCMTACIEACEYDDVEARVTQATFPASPKVTALTTYLNRAFPPVTPEYAYSEEDARNMVLFEMSYQSLEYEVTTKMEKTTDGTFISNIGGALGVWTGLSLMSIFQALVYFAQFLWRVMKSLAK